MFNKKSEELIEEAVRVAVEENNDVWERKAKKINADHSISIQQKDFDLEHLETSTVKELKDQITDLEKKVAVLEGEKVMLDRIVDLNADVLDVKNLVKDLVAKLPSIDLKNLTINSNSGKK